jgi:hypothetical protein
LSGAEASASGQQTAFPATLTIDGNRFSSESAWKGVPGPTQWWWQLRLGEPREIGAILQITGDHSYALTNAPQNYRWEYSLNGKNWKALTEVRAESRTFRVHRFREKPRAAYLRLKISAVAGAFPSVREIELYSGAADAIEFPDWIVAVNTTDQSTVPGEGRQFIPLARSCPGWERLQAQQIWIGNLDEPYLKVEPRPLCVFLSGNFKDWCEISREPWRGTEQILKNRAIPIWASCGGAQGLALLAEVGVDRPWDCPHCRDPLNPKSPIYGHIGHTGKRPCGDYSACVFERGPHAVRRLNDDAAFKGLTEEFRVMESHCGQIEYLPRGWELIATAGPGTETKTQCMRLKGECIYAAQFHIELDGTWDVSRRIMGNFLELAKQWPQRSE